MNFFRGDISEIVGAYFDGAKIFVVRLTEKFETVAVNADALDIEHVAEKILLVCRQRGWRTQAVGFCLRESDAVTYQTDINIPAEELDAFVISWARAHGGKDAASAFVITGGEIWMETLPRTTTDEITAAFRRRGLNLRALTVMPADLLTKTEPFRHAEFIADIVRQRKSPNFLARSSAVDWRRVSAAVAAIFFAAIVISSVKLFADYGAASAELDAAKISADSLRDDLAIKQAIDADSAELNRLNRLAAANDITPTKFNLLVNVGRVSGVHLTGIRADENFLEVEGLSDTPDAVRNYLSRVKTFAPSARLERSTEDGFTIRATT